MMSDLSMECWRLLLFSADDIREKASEAILERNSANVTFGQVKVMKAVALLTFNNQNGVMLKTLAEKVKLTSGAVSIIVDSLVQQGFLERRHSEVDRRAVSIFLSEKGKERASLYAKFYTELITEFLNEQTEEDRNTFVRLLDRLHKKINS